MGKPMKEKQYRGTMVDDAGNRIPLFSKAVPEDEGAQHWFDAEGKDYGRCNQGNLFFSVENVKELRGRAAKLETFGYTKNHDEMVGPLYGVAIRKKFKTAFGTEKTMMRIVAMMKLRDDVPAGTVGGWIEKEYALANNAFSGYPYPWVGEDAKVMDFARVTHNASIRGNAVLAGDAVIAESACVAENARVSETAIVSGRALVCGNAVVSGNARVYGMSAVFGSATVRGLANVGGDARVFGSSVLDGDAYVSGSAKVFGCANVTSGHIVKRTLTKSNTPWDS